MAQKRVTKIISRLEHSSYNDSLREQRPGEGRFLGDLIVAFQYLKKANKKERGQRFTPPDRDKTRGNIFILKDKRFRLDVKKEIYLEGAEAVEKVAQRSYGCHMCYGCHCSWPGCMAF